MTCPADHPHDVTCYTAHKCRDHTCRQAWARYHGQWRGRTTKPTPHGTYGGYTNHGCRCPDCTKAMSVKRAEQRAWKRLQDGGL
jgi:hypothetical protein